MNTRMSPAQTVSLFCSIAVLCLAGCERAEPPRSFVPEGRPAAGAVAAVAKEEPTPTPLPTATPMPMAAVPTLDPSPALRLLVSSTPATVLITRAGELLAQTNLPADEEVNLGALGRDLDVLISAPGYQPHRQRLTLSQLQQPIRLELQPVQGILQVKATSNAKILIRDEVGNVVEEGASGLYGVYETRLREGAYEVEISKPNHQSQILGVEVRHGAPQSLEIVLEGHPGRLWVASPQPCEVWVDGQQAGMTDMAISNIPPGERRIELKRTGFKSAEMVVQVPPNSYVPLIAPALTPSFGALVVEIDSSDESDTHLDGIEKTVTIAPRDCRRVMKTLLFRDVACGRGEVTVEAKGYRMKDGPVKVEVRDGATNQVRVVMEPLPAQATVLAEPPGAVVHDAAGTPLGLAGAGFPLRPFRPHTLICRLPGHEDYSLTLPPLLPGAATNAVVRLSPSIRLGDLIVNPNSSLAPLEGLAKGSEEAQRAQLRTASLFNLPLEVRAAKSGIAMRLIPPGEFLMGSPLQEPGRRKDEGQPLTEENAEPQVKTVFTRPFYAATHEVTWAQWRRVMGTGPTSVNDEAPAERVSWNDCQVFLEDLCELEGVPAGTYRLLTEAEWEYCCRAGTQGAVYGDGRGEGLAALAWHIRNSKTEGAKTGGPRRAGLLKPNAWGLFDMLGNVWEWCQDAYQPAYTPAPRFDPPGPEQGATRVARGGGWSSAPDQCRAAQRYPNGPNYKDESLGFRIARKAP